MVYYQATKKIQTIQTSSKTVQFNSGLLNRNIKRIYKHPKHFFITGVGYNLNLQTPNTIYKSTETIKTITQDKNRKAKRIKEMKGAIPRPGRGPPWARLTLDHLLPSSFL